MPSRPRASARTCSSLETEAVVLDRRGDLLASAGEDDANLARGRVLHDIRQRLLDDAVERRLDLVGQTVVERRLDRRLDPTAFGERLPQALDSRPEPEVVERRRPELNGER